MKDKKPKHPGGRPSKLTPDVAFDIFLLARKGLTDVEIARIIKVDQSTITNWKKSPEFFASLKEAKEDADAIVERSLFERANGYTHPEEKLFVIDGKIVRETVTKHYPPDPASMIFFLKNRNPQKWRDRIPELSNLADELGSVLQQLRKQYEKTKR